MKQRINVFLRERDVEVFAEISSHAANRLHLVAVQRGQVLPLGMNYFLLITLHDALVFEQFNLPSSKSFGV